jgi:hypothetical protein
MLWRRRGSQTRPPLYLCLPFDQRTRIGWGAVLRTPMISARNPKQVPAPKWCHRPAYWSRAVIGMWEPVAWEDAHRADTTTAMLWAFAPRGKPANVRPGPSSVRGSAGLRWEHSGANGLARGRGLYLYSERPDAD